MHRTEPPNTRVQRTRAARFARTRSPLTKGVPYFRNAGVEHDVINPNAFEFAFVEIELK